MYQEYGIRQNELEMLSSKMKESTRNLKNGQNEDESLHNSF